MSMQDPIAWSFLDRTLSFQCLLSAADTTSNFFPFSKTAKAISQFILLMNIITAKMSKTIQTTTNNKKTVIKLF